MRKRRELAEGSSVRRMSSNRVSAVGGNFAATACRSKIELDLVAFSVSAEDRVWVIDCISPKSLPFTRREAPHRLARYHRRYASSVCRRNAGLRSCDNGAV